MQSSFEPHEIEFFAKLIDEATRAAGIEDESLRSLAATRLLALAETGERDREKLLAAAASTYNRQKDTHAV